jgi:hypothetical protein
MNVSGQNLFRLLLIFSQRKLLKSRIPGAKPASE